MFSFFKKSEKQGDTTAVLTESPNQYPAVVHKIHNEFMTAGDKLLKESLEILEECAKNDTQKGLRLRTLGFTSTPQAVTLTEIERKQKEAEANAKLVQYYSLKYPNNKFITKEMLLKICEKYNLVFGSINRFTGFVPEKNLQEIENFKIRKEDEGIGFSNGFFFKNGEIRREGQYYHIFKKNETDKYRYAYQSNDNEKFYGHDSKDIFGMEKFGFVNDMFLNEGNFMICAPIDDMVVKFNERISKSRTIERIPDPVVTKEVEGGYLMVTAWGDEASDELVVNQKFN